MDKGQILVEKLTCVEYCQLVCGLKVILHALVSIRIGHNTM